MSLITEDGAGIENADSYTTEENAQTIAASYGITLPTDATEAETALRQGYLNVNTNEHLLQGSRVYAVQTGAFPRIGVMANGFELDSSSIPNDIILAQIYAASAISSGVDTNAVDNGQNLASFSVNGVYSESYQDGSRVKVNSRIQGVYNSLKPYFKSTVSGGESYRDFTTIGSDFNGWY